jgi:hypothetical protein
LAVGTMVLTRDNALQPVRWIGRVTLSAERLRAQPNLRPIRIAAGALGPNLPAQPLLVSPHHRILVRSAIAQRMFGAVEILVAAKQLLPLEGIDIAQDLETVEYFHVLFDRHEIVFANGTETESLYTGPQALRAVPRGRRSSPCSPNWNGRPPCRLRRGNWPAAAWPASWRCAIFRTASPW